MTGALDIVTVAGPVDLPLTGELDVQAACGIMHVHGRRSGGPRRSGSTTRPWSPVSSPTWGRRR